MLFGAAGPLLSYGTASTMSAAPAHVSRLFFEVLFFFFFGWNGRRNRAECQGFGETREDMWVVSDVCLEAVPLLSVVVLYIILCMYVRASHLRVPYMADPFWKICWNGGDSQATFYFEV